MRALSIFGIVSLFVTAVIHATPSEKPGSAQFKYAVVAFDHEANRVICEGHISTGQFQKWFKKDYGVSGERIETPNDAIAFGALVLTDGDEILAMPLYRWRNEKVSLFSCASQAIGRAPMFYVVEQTEEAFYHTIKGRLEELSKAEPSASANGASPRS